MSYGGKRWGVSRRNRYFHQQNGKWILIFVLGLLMIKCMSVFD